MWVQCECISSSTYFLCCSRAKLMLVCVTDVVQEPAEGEYALTQTSYPLSTSSKGKHLSLSVKHTHTSLFISKPWCKYTTFFLIPPLPFPALTRMSSSPLLHPSRCSPNKYPSPVCTIC